MMMRALGLVLVVLLTAPTVAGAQDADWASARELRTRTELQDLLTRLEEAAASSSNSEELRARAKYEAALVRNRLKEGDFLVGDRILLQVRDEETLSDTFAVRDGRELDLPEIGRVSLAGVLRAELQPYLTEYLGRYLRDPEVRARALLRVAVVGSVSEPGFYLLPSEALITDALMLAGGPTGDAKITSIRIERGDDRIWGGDPLQEAISEGRTLDQLNLQAGDRILVPRSGGGVWGTVRNVSLLAGLLLTATLIAARR